MGWNGSGGGAKPPVVTKRAAKKPSALRGVLAGGLIVAAAGVAVWLLMPSDKPHPSSSVPRSSSRIKEVTPARAAKAAQPVVEKEKVAEKPVAPAKKEEFKMPAILQTETIEEGVIVSEVPTNMPSHLRNPYKSQVEVLLSMLGKPGTPYTPIPLDPNQDLEGDFMKAMENTIIVWEDESVQSEEHKLAVNSMKKLLAEAKQQGWKVGDLLKALEQERKHQWEMVSKAQAILNETEEAMPEHTKAVREALNKELAEAGVDPMKETETESEVQQKGVGEDESKKDAKGQKDVKNESQKENQE